MHAGYLRPEHIHRICNIHCLYTAISVTRTRHNVNFIRTLSLLFLLFRGSKLSSQLTQSPVHWVSCPFVRGWSGRCVNWLIFPFSAYVSYLCKLLKDTDYKKFKNWLIEQNVFLYDQKLGKFASVTLQILYGQRAWQCSVECVHI